MSKSALSQSKGFTLVELLVVITIIAILSVIGITVFTSVQKNARDAKRRADIDAVLHTKYVPIWNPELHPTIADQTNSESYGIIFFSVV